MLDVGCDVECDVSGVHVRACARMWQAAEQAAGSMDRLLLVAAFAMSAFQSVRPMRASLPVMGETVEVTPLNSSRCAPACHSAPVCSGEALSFVHHACMASCGMARPRSAGTSALCSVRSAEHPPWR